MSTVSGNVFRVLLDRLPPSDRALALRDIARGLHESQDYNAAKHLTGVLEDYPDGDATRLLEEFLLASIGSGDAKSVAFVCINSTNVRDVLLSKASTSLDLEAVSLRADLGFIEDGCFHPEYSGSSSGPSLDIFSGVIQCNLGFLAHVFCMTSTDNALDINQSVARSIFPYLLAKDEAQFTTARDAIFALLGAIRRLTVTVHGSPTGPTLNQEIWSSCVHSITVLTDESPHGTTALQIWLRWLDLPLERDLCHKLFNDDEYWEVSLYTLFEGGYEQIKSCLHIMRMSIAIAVEQDIEVRSTHIKLVGTRSAKSK